MLKKLLTFTLSVLAISVIFLCSVWINLDSSSMTPWLEKQINSQLPKDLKAELSGIDNYLLGSLINQVRLKRVHNNEVILTIDSVDVWLNPFSFIVNQSLDFNCLLYEGSFSGRFKVFTSSVDFDFSDIQINRNRFIRKSKIVLSNPIISGTGAYSLQGSVGTFSLGSSAITFSGKQEDTNLPFSFPNTSFTAIQTDFSLLGRKLELNLSTKGDIDIVLNGGIDLDLKRFEKSKNNMVLTAQMKEKYESGLGFLKSFLVNYKDKTGKLSVSITGSFQRPIFKKKNQ